MLSIGIVKERKNNENRVSLVPKDILNLFKIGFKKIYIEKNSGLLSGYNDNDYIKYGGLIKDKKKIWNNNIILTINFPKLKYLFLLKNNSILICLDKNLDYVNNLKILKKKKITLIVLSYIPRISRLQTMDVLSSISYISGYRAVIEGIYEYRNFIGNQIFSCGKIKPVNILIIGAGIFGLSAISFSKSLGANVYVYDINKNLKEEVVSLGAKFLDISDNNFMSFLFKKVNKFNIIINSIIYKDKNFSLVFTKKILNLMKCGSVIVNLIDDNVSDCIYFKKNGLLKFNNVKIISYNDFSNLMPRSTSKLYSNNLINILSYILNNKKNIYFNFKDIFFKNVLILYKGKEKKKKYLLNKKIKYFYSNKNAFFFLKYIILYFLFLFYLFFLFFLHNYYYFIYLNNLFIFLFSYILGYIGINKIKNFLHTPLMSLTNAISSITIIGCLLQINENNNLLNLFFSLVTLSLVNINIFSGFFITKRMLKIFFN